MTPSSNHGSIVFQIPVTAQRFVKFDCFASRRYYEIVVLLLRVPAKQTVLSDIGGKEAVPSDRRSPETTPRQFIDLGCLLPAHAFYINQHLRRRPGLIYPPTCIVSPQIQLVHVVTHIRQCIRDYEAGVSLRSSSERLGGTLPAVKES